MTLHGTVQRLTRFFGERSYASPEPGTWSGVPSDLVQGGAVAISGATPWPYGLGNTDRSSVPLDVPGVGAQGSVIAIGIAPDSPIAECNLHIGNSGYHRIGVGSPYIGAVDEWRNVRISPARGLPTLYQYKPTAVPTFANYQSYVRVWDCGVIGVIGFPNTRAAPQIPVRLNLYRGPIASLVPAITKRSGYHAEAVWFKDDAVATHEPTLIVITDGRRRVRVRASSNNAGATLEIYGIESSKGFDIVGTFVDGDIDVPTFDQLLPPTLLNGSAVVETIFDWSGNPYFAFACTITGATPINSYGHISVDAYDD